MYRKDWTPKPNAVAWKDLVLKEWRTNISKISADNGKVNVRGHLGLYKITVKKGNKEVKASYQLTKDGTPAEIQLQ